VLVTPINLVPDPKPDSYSSWAIIVSDPKQLDLGNPCKPIRGEELDVNRETGFLLDDFMIVKFEAKDSTSPCYVLAVRQNGLTILADSRNPQLFMDEPLYRASLADWRPSIEHLRLADKDPLFAIALRIHFELYVRSIPKPQEPQPWETTPDDQA